MSQSNMTANTVEANASGRGIGPTVEVDYGLERLADSIHETIQGLYGTDGEKFGKPVSSAVVVDTLGDDEEGRKVVENWNDIVKRLRDSGVLRVEGGKEGESDRYFLASQSPAPHGDSPEQAEG